MVQQPRSGYGYAGWVSVLIGVTLPALFVVTDRALAQRRPIADDTLGNERSIVTPLDPDLPVDRIDGGAERGDNLFHSFQEFHVDEGRGVYFDDRGFANIISRVTGGVASDILGVLGVIGDANLFLINPSGIIFGPGARLDVSGSFVATTADAIQFGDQGFFSASEPNAPPLLTVQPSAFLFNQVNPGAIENQSLASLGEDGLGNQVFGLRVPNGQKLVLLGGNIIINGDLNAFGGQVELGSVAGTGAVGFNADGSLSFPENLARADVLITNGSRIDVASNNGGDITINARNINVLGNSLLRAGIFAGLGTVDSQAGNIVLNGTGEIRVGQSSSIVNNVGAGGIGNSGNIIITAGSLSVIGGAELQALTYGQGNAGNVIITADNRVVFDDGNAFSTVGNANFDGLAVGDGGNVQIRTGLLEVSNGAALVTSTFGQGNAGNVIIDADDRVVFDGIGADGFPSAASSTVGSINFNGTVVGDGGDVRIRTGSLEVLNGAQLQASTFGQGNAGDVIIDADDRVVFNGIGADGELFTGAFSSVDNTGMGNGGNVEINAGSLEVTDGARLQAFTQGQGNAGNVIIDASDRVVFDDGIALSSVGESGVGDGGNIDINTGSLAVRNGAQLAASTAGQGNAGNIQINARDTVSLDGVSSIGLSSGLFTLTFAGATGQGGEITVHANTIRLADGAVINAGTGNTFRGGNVTLDADTFEATGGGQVITTTSSIGQAGDITLNATDRVTLSGFDPNYDDRLTQFGNRARNQGETSGLFANTTDNSSGQGGTIRITTEQLEVSERARVGVNNQGSVNNSSRGVGNAGDIEIVSPLIELNNGILDASTVFGRGGNIQIQAPELVLLRRNSLISAQSDVGGDDGNIDIDTTFLIAALSENSDIVALTSTTAGIGNSIRINAEVIFGFNYQAGRTEQSDITATGSLTITSPYIDVDLSRGLTELPADVVDVSGQIAQTCPTDGDVAGELGEFVVTGRGGLPANPAEILGGETVLRELAEVEGEGDEGDGGNGGNGEVERDDRSSTATNPQPEIVEAQGWGVGADGKVILAAENPAVEPHGSPIAPVSCPSS